MPSPSEAPARPLPRSETSTLHWLALRLVPGLGARRTLDLLERFHSPEAIFRTPVTELCAAGLARAVAQSIASGCTFDDAAHLQDQLKAGNVTTLTLGDDAYPRRLREIFDPPPVLFFQGREELLASVVVSVVGTRRPTAYGKAVARKMASELAAAGVVVASGMARGIDTASHLGALEAGGGTIAVYACGLDHVYPAENRALAERIAREGLLLSEFPLGAPPYPQNFPIRNRVVSGLAAGVLVVEGSQNSGSSITARLALDQNREVFAIPGNITSPMSFGPNLLLKQGAHLIQQATDIFDALPWDDRRRLAAPASAPAQPSQASLPLGPRTALASQLVDLISVDAPVGLDTLLDWLPDFSSSEIIAALFDLELNGVIRQLPGKTFVKVWS
jgi:DNA processing protein